MNLEAWLPAATDLDFLRLEVREGRHIGHYGQVTIDVVITGAHR